MALIAVGGMQHETNTFAPTRADYEAFVQGGGWPSIQRGEPMFEAVLHEASADSQVPVSIVEKRMQGRDHPVLLGVPETYYLKCFILRRLD